MNRLASRFVFVLLLASGTGISVSEAVAETPTPADNKAELFSRLPIMTGAQLSPDGTRIAFLSSLQGRNHLVIERFKPDFSRHIVAPSGALDFDWVHWANNDRLVFSSSFSARRYLTETTETRLFSIDGDSFELAAIIKPATRKETGSRIGKKLPPPQIQDDVVDWLVDDPDHILVSVDGDHNGAYEIRRVNVNDGDYKIVSGGILGVQNWLVDQSSEVRLAWGYRNRDDKLKIDMKNTAGQWAPVTKIDWWDYDFLPVAFTEDPAVAFMQGPNESGISVIRKMNLETGEFLETVFEHSSVDADKLVFDGITGRPVGVAYTEHMPMVQYFDQTLEALQNAIDKAFPGMSNRITSMSNDRKQILIFSYSSTNPGAYFLWDRNEKSISHYSDSMPDLPPELLSPVEEVSYKSRDGLVIPGYLTIPKGLEATKLPTIVLPHGGPESRTDKRFWFLTQFLAAHGYAVLQPNFRGSSGYGRDFADAGVKEWGGKMQDDVTDGAQWLISEGITDPERLCIVGWSYGGYVAAMGAIKTPDLFKCAASINGVLNLVRQIEDDKDYIGGGLWTRHMGLEGENIKAVSPYHQAERIKIPMLIIQARDDPVVHRNQGAGMADRLQDLDRPVEYIEIELGGHSMTNELARLDILRSLETFLAKNIGGK